jgi:predicted glycosyltransferase
MGAPTSTILGETSIQDMEGKYIYPILKAQQIIAYYRYVDHILTVYNKRKTNIEKTLNDFNNVRPSIKFTRTIVKKNMGKLSRHAIHRKNNQLEFSICRKPTQTDIIINNSSCYPYEHKLSVSNIY